MSRALPLSGGLTARTVALANGHSAVSPGSGGTASVTDSLSLRLRPRMGRNKSSILITEVGDLERVLALDSARPYEYAGRPASQLCAAR